MYVRATIKTHSLSPSNMLSKKYQEVRMHRKCCEMLLMLYCVPELCAEIYCARVWCFVFCFFIHFQDLIFAFIF